MSEESAHDVTRLLDDLSAGKTRALDNLMPLVYRELRRQAAKSRRIAISRRAILDFNCVWCGTLRRPRRLHSRPMCDVVLSVS